MSRIFISHSTKNNAAALGIARWLEDLGCDDYFLDISPSRGLSPGERWLDALKAAADRCEAVLFLVSPAWRTSTMCLTEFYLAKQLGKTIFGVLIEPTPFEELPKELTSEWQLCDLIRGAARWTRIVSDDPHVLPVEISFGEVGLRKLQLGLEKAGVAATTFAWPPPRDPDRAPYRGLKPLEAADAAIFFGRDATIVRALDKLRQLREVGEPMLAILGASGSGKSSFLRAGIWPRLARDDRHFLPLPVIRPGTASISGAAGMVASLEAAFRDRGRPLARAAIRARLEEPHGFNALMGELRDIATARLETGAHPPTIVVSIDQAEELLAAEGRDESDRLLELLFSELTSKLRPTDEGIGGPRDRTLVVLTIRSDFFEQLQTDARLEGFNLDTFSLPPVGREEFKAVIEGPAARATTAGRKLVIHPELTEQLIRDARGVDALPLLAFTLERLFVEHGGDGDLLPSEYEALGGVAGSIAAAVKAAFAEPVREPAVPADEAERERLLRIGFVPWLALVDPDTDARKRQVASWAMIPTDAHPLLDRLIEQRLLVRDERVREDGVREIVVEIAHEALLRQWPTLARWLDENADTLKALEATKRAAADWQKNERRPEWLTHTGLRLQTAEALRSRGDFETQLATNGRAYLVACRRRDDEIRADRERQLADTARVQRRVSYLLGVLAVLLLAASALVMVQTRATARERSLILASEAELANDTGRFEQALRYALIATAEGWLAPATSEAWIELARAAHHSSLIATLNGHEGRVRSAEFSPDGTRVVTASEDNTVRVWDAATGSEITALKRRMPEVQTASFSDDGTFIIAASTTMAWVRDAATGKRIAAFDVHDWDDVGSAAFSHDGTRVVTTSRDDTTMRVSSVPLKTESTTLRGYDGGLFLVAFSPDGARIVTASNLLDGTTVRVWNAVTGTPITTLDIHEELVSSATFSADSSRIVTTSEDKPARVWDAETGAEIATLRGHRGAVWAAAFSPDGTRIVTASKDKTARIWDAEAEEQIGAFHEHRDDVSAATFSRDGKRVVTGSMDGTARIWNAQFGDEVASLNAHRGEVTTATFSPDGTRVVTASSDTTARLWDAQTATQIAVLSGHVDGVSSASFSPDATRVVTASRDKTARVWDAQTGREIAILEGHSGRVWTATFSRDGARVVTASSDKSVRVWDAATGKEIAVSNGHSTGVRTATFSRDGTRVVSTSDDKIARIWDPATRRETLLMGHQAPVHTAKFNPDGSLVVTASDDKTARLWDAATGNEIAVLNGHNGSVLTAAFDPDGTHVVTASDDKTARVWNVSTGRETAILAGHEEQVRAAEFSPDGTRIVTVSGDWTTRVWDAVTGKESAALRGFQPRNVPAEFSPDGTRIVTASYFSVQLWTVAWSSLDRASLRTAVCQTKILGARTITQSDVAAAPILVGHVGEDACAR